MGHTLALIAVAGCAAQPLNARLEDVERARPQLTAGQSVSVQAQIEGEDETETVVVAPSDVVTATIDHQPIDLKISDLLQRHDVDSSVTVGERYRMSNTTPSYIAGAVLVLGLVGTGVCAFECHRPWNLISDGVLVTTGVLVLAAVVTRALSDRPSVLLGPLFW